MFIDKFRIHATMFTAIRNMNNRDKSILGRERLVGRAH